MTAHETAAFDVTETYVHLPDGGAATPVENSPDFWPDLASGATRYDGRLMTAHPLSGDMGHWELHPAGEEVLVSIGAAVEVILQRDGSEEVIHLDPGKACIVPRGTWHRIRVVEAGVLVFITHGESTEHRPL